MPAGAGAGAGARPLAWLALAALLPFVALAVLARATPLGAWELEVVNRLAIGAGPWDELVRLVNTLGNPAPWAAIVAVLAIALGAIRGASAAVLAGLSFAADLAAFATKLLVERSRPETVATEHFTGADTFAYPSGHVVRAVALVAIVAWLLAPARLRLRLAVGAAIVAGVTMGYARVALGVHWPTDALGGLLLGLGWFSASAWMLLPRRS